MGTEGFKGSEGLEGIYFIPFVPSVPSFPFISPIRHLEAKPNGAGFSQISENVNTEEDNLAILLDCRLAYLH